MGQFYALSAIALFKLLPTELEGAKSHSVIVSSSNHESHGFFEGISLQIQDTFHVSSEIANIILIAIATTVMFLLAGSFLGFIILMGLDFNKLSESFTILWEQF